MPHHRRTRSVALALEFLETREAPSVTPLTETFDTTPLGQLPAGWQQWSNTGRTIFSVSDTRALSAAHSLASASTPDQVAARAWVAAPQEADVEVSVALYPNTSTAAQLIVRGSGLNTTTPTYYGLAVTAGLQTQLIRVQKGVTTVLASLNTASWMSTQWVLLTLAVSGTTLKAQVYRTDTHQYLDATGHWQTDSAWALTTTDAAITGAGQVGFARSPSYGGTLFLDDFHLLPPAGDTRVPTVSFANLSQYAAMIGVKTVQVLAADNVAVNRVEFYVDGVLRTIDLQAPYTWAFDSSSTSNGWHTLKARAVDVAGNSAEASLTVLSVNATALPDPSVPQHLSWIRVAEVAYGPNQIGAFETNLLRQAVDVVITDPGITSAPVSAASPTTPQLLYSNLSTLALGLLTDWLTYADSHSLARESAFYHVTAATPYSGTSPSSQPVNWFWAAYRNGPSFHLNMTAGARGTQGLAGSFGGQGQSLYLGYPDRFREVNVNLIAPGSSTWSAALEYPTAVDANGNPTAWAPLKVLQDGTAGVKHSGRITFDPPADWKPVSIDGSARLYYVRFRTTGTGAAPLAASILGRDYTGANGGNAGVVPAFDTAADSNGDGYLNDAEYARRAPGKDARFLYESRALDPAYGEMRFVTNPSVPGFRAWAMDYLGRELQGRPTSVGLFIDNSGGLAPVAAGQVRESVATYQDDYASLLNAISRTYPARLVVANTWTDPIIRNTTGFYNEFALKPLADTYSQFETMVDKVARWLALRSPSPYGILDVLPQNGSPTDPRTQLASLAYYYLLADPHRTFVNFFGGYATTTSWTQHWVPAVNYNVGAPLDASRVFATGADPANAALTYRVYARTYANALVLYKPLSGGTGVAGTTADATATTHALGGSYRILRADGTIGPVIATVTLRNGEGAILVKA